MKQSVMILGGYGNFGKRIAELLSEVPTIEVIIAGRRLAKAQQELERLRPSAQAELRAVEVDSQANGLETTLRKIKPTLLIHTVGPFQGQDFRVPKACIAHGIHYIDLADDRHYVCSINQLHREALAADVLVVSGASSVPGLSSVVLDKYATHFHTLEAIDIAIAPGNKAERGFATVHGILSYTGHPFPVFNKGQWRKAYGWMDARRLDFGDTLGHRWLANVDVPDLALFPDRYQTTDSVRFQAGLELGFLHLAMVFMAWLAKIGLVKNWAPLAKPIFHASDWFKHWGTDNGGMRVKLSGRTPTGESLTLTWRLTAENGVGPYIPTLSAVILAKHLLSGHQVTRGALPCLGLYTLEEFQPYADKLGLKLETVFNG